LPPSSSHKKALGTGVFANLANNNLVNAFDIGGGRSAYFEEGSLRLIVIPESSTILLGRLGLLALVRRRRLVSHHAFPMVAVFLMLSISINDTLQP
jgi:hypothetical protein